MPLNKETKPNEETKPNQTKKSLKKQLHEKCCECTMNVIL